VTWKLQTLNSKCLVGLNDLIMAIFPNLRLAVSVVVYSVDYISPTLLFRRVQFEWMRCCIGIRRLKLKLKKTKVERVYITDVDVEDVLAQVVCLFASFSGR